MSVLVVGSVALDSVKTPFGSHDDLLGGSATYFSISASYFTDVRLVAVVGRDFPKKHIDLLERYGVKTKGLIVEDGETFRWKGVYEYDMNVARTISTHLNVFENFDPVIPGQWRKSRNVFLANIDPDLQAKVLTQMDSPRLVAADSMNFWIENKKRSLTKLLKNIHIFLVNDAEARELSGETNLLKASKYILSLGPRMVVVKKGEHGCLLVTKKEFFSVPGYPLEDIYDPTGAGDTFAGGLMGYLSCQNKIDVTSVKRGIIFGSAMASYNVEAFSLERLLKLNRRLIDRRYSQFKQLVKF
jgi:sugar/nucleoside kinase (ribokinase family)